MPKRKATTVAAAAALTSAIVATTGVVDASSATSSIRTSPSSSHRQLDNPLQQSPHHQRQLQTTELCSCSPTSYEFRLNFNSRCGAGPSNAGIIAAECWFSQGTPDEGGFLRGIAGVGGGGRDLLLSDGEWHTADDNADSSSQEEYFKSLYNDALLAGLSHPGGKLESLPRQQEQRDVQGFDPRPTVVTDVTFIEFNRDIEVINQDSTYSNVTLVDGDVIVYESISDLLNISVPLDEQIDQVPEGVMMLLYGVNRDGQNIQNTIIVGYNLTECNIDPFAGGSGGAFGWPQLTDYDPPKPPLCPAVTYSPTMAPTITAEPTNFPTTPLPTQSPTLSKQPSMIPTPSPSMKPSVSAHPSFPPSISILPSISIRPSAITPEPTTAIPTEEPTYVFNKAEVTGTPTVAPKTRRPTAGSSKSGKGSKGTKSTKGSKASDDYGVSGDTTTDPAYHTSTGKSSKAEGIVQPYALFPKSSKNSKSSKSKGKAEDLTASAKAAKLFKEVKSKSSKGGAQVYRPKVPTASPVSLSPNATPRPTSGSSELPPSSLEGMTAFPTVPVSQMGGPGATRPPAGLDTSIMTDSPTINGTYAPTVTPVPSTLVTPVPTIEQETSTYPPTKGDEGLATYPPTEERDVASLAPTVKMATYPPTDANPVVTDSPTVPIATYPPTEGGVDGDGGAAAQATRPPRPEQQLDEEPL